MKRRSLTGILPVIFLGIATETPTLIAQSTGTFSATGSMATGRYGHTATLLRDGRVLIAGGFTDASGLYAGIPDFRTGGITATAELYDPVTGTFTPTGNMTAARAYHSATLLQDGRVLIASGRGTDRSEDNLASAELFDPLTETFTATGNMSTHSFNDVNTATLLRDGRVLITGVSRAELYDPVSGTFTVTGNMTVPPTFATATLLPDGRVLLANLEHAAIYDPATESFIATRGTTAGETGGAILLPNGKVLVAGGNNDPGPLDIAELYDPSTATFAGTGNMTAPRSNFTMSRLPDGKVLIGGGSTWTAFTLPGGATGMASACCLNSVDLYDPDIGVFTAAGSMAAARAGQTATLLQGGQVLIVGGSGGVPVDASTLSNLFPSFGFLGGAIALATAELYTPAQASLPTSWVQVISKNSGKCLDVTGGPSATDPGTPIQQWACWGGSNQAFLFTPVEGGYEITAQNSGLQLDVTGGPAAVEDGVHVIQWPYWGGSNEIWQVLPVADGYYKIVALNSGKCLDVDGISLSDGAAVQQWSCWGGDNQSWQLVPIP
jgi:hypothetical protein